MNKDRLNHYVLGVDWSCLIPTHADFSVKPFSGDFLAANEIYKIMSNL